MAKLLRIIHFYLWRPSLGDPLWVTSLIVAVYGSAALLCLTYTLRLRHSDSRQRGNLQRLYWLQTILLFLLALVRQSRLDQRITGIGRSWASAAGWYSFRTPVQEDAITIIVIIGGVVLLAASWSLRAVLRHHWPSLLGVVALLTYTTMRAVSLHAVDALLYRRVLGLRWDWVFESSLLLFICCAHALALFRQRKDLHPLYIGDKEIER